MWIPELLQPINNVFIINGIEKVIISQEINYTAFFGNLAYKVYNNDELPNSSGIRVFKNNTYYELVII
jgi:DNA-directed RNA polymerase beta subunit